MLSSRWTGAFLLGVAAAAAIAGGDPGLLVAAVVAVGLVIGTGRVSRERARGRRQAAATRGGGYWRARLPVATAVLVWPHASRRLSAYGAVSVALTADADGVTIGPTRAAALFAGLRPRRLGWAEIVQARLPAGRSHDPPPSPSPPPRGAVLLTLRPSAATAVTGGGPVLLLYADAPDTLVRLVAQRLPG